MSDIVDAMKTKIPVEGKVTGINKGGFNVKIMGQKAFCPISQMDLKRVEDPNVFLNKSLTFVIARVTEGGRNIVVSRLPLLEADMGEILDRLAVMHGSENRCSGHHQPHHAVRPVRGPRRVRGAYSHIGSVLGALAGPFQDV